MDTMGQNPPEQMPRGRIFQVTTRQNRRERTPQGRHLVCVPRGGPRAGIEREASVVDSREDVRWTHTGALWEGSEGAPP